MDRRSFVKEAMLHGFYEELEKIAAAQAIEKLASTGLGINDLVKLAMVDDEIYQLMKQAGFFERLGKGTQRAVKAGRKKARNLYNAAQVGTGNLMTGSFGHAGEHAAQKLITTASPTKALMVAAADPHAQHAVAEGARKAGKYVGRRASNLAQHARAAFNMSGPGGPGALRPAFA